MVDAWKNGGKVEGEGVDDDRLLDHMKKRRDVLSKDDPLWDEWNNNYIQYDFSINESKMALKNDQGKISDGEMAAFYRKWAGRTDVQQDSEFYRSLLSSAAKWAEAAKGRAAGSNAAAKAEAHAKWANGYYKNHVQGSETAGGYLLLIAKTYGAAPPGADSLADINQNSDAYARFLDVISDGKADGAPVVQGLIDEMNEKISKTNPNWKYSESNLMDLLDRGDKGLDRLTKESTSKTEENTWAGRREDLRFGRARIRQTRANEAVQIAADTYVEDLGRCGGDPYCAREQTQKFRDSLGRHAKDIIGGTGSAIAGNSLALQDTKTASALNNTIMQLDAALSGKPIKTPAAKAGMVEPYVGEGEPPEGYTVFDAAAANDSPRGFLASVWNIALGDIDKMDRGGWIMTEPVVGQGGVPILDGQGRPKYTFSIHDPNEPQPLGAVAVPGTTEMIDNTRTSQGPTGPTGTRRTPITYVLPSEPNVTFEDPVSKTSVDPKVQGNVRLFDGLTEVPPPWQELRGVRGPDGVARTIYRTGDGSAERPFLFHENAPVPPEGTSNAVRKNAAGQFIIPVTPTTDPEGKTFLRADIGNYVAGVGSARTKSPTTGNYAFGTYSSAGAAQTSKVIADLFANKDPKANETADKYLRQYTQGLENLHPNDPNRAAGMRDINQLTETVGLYKQGKAGSAVAAAYGAANKRDPKMDQYANTLTSSGFTAARYGQDEFDRRVSVLAGIDEADQRIANRPSRAPGYYGAPGRGMYLGQEPGEGANAMAQRALLEQQKKDVLNPTISLSNIKVPGMPGMRQPTTFVPFGAGAAAQYGITAPPTTQYTPPSRLQGPSTTGAPMGGAIAPTGIAGPTTTFKPPTAPAPMPGPSTAAAAAAKYAPPTAPKLPVIEGYKQQYDLYGNPVYIGTGANAGKKAYL